MHFRSLDISLIGETFLSFFHKWRQFDKNDFLIFFYDMKAKFYEFYGTFHSKLYFEWKQSFFTLGWKEYW